MIVGLFTDVLSAGGVQRAGRHVAAVASEFAAAQRMPCRFLSLNDTQGLHTIRVASTEFLVSGYARSKSQFILAALRAAGRKPQLVLALHPHLAPIVWAMGVRSRNFRSIILAHGIEVWRPLKWPRGQALRRADMIAAPSSDTIQHLIVDQKVPREKIRRLPWGLDPEFEGRLAAPVSSVDLDIPADGRVILTVGRWDPAEKYKGADTLIAALPRILRTVPNTFLVLVGDGGDRPRLEQLARDQEVPEHTRFLHGLTAEELFAWYARCDLFALPSRGEGFGLVFLEAMAHGKPVIGGAHGGTLDVIEDGVSGLLVPHGDVDALAAAAESILSDPKRAAEMGAHARVRLQHSFSYEQFRANLTGILNDVLDGKR